MRPDRRAAKQSLRSVSALLGALGGVVAEEENLRAAAGREANGMRHAAAVAELASMDVDTLNAGKAGIRVSALRAAGVDNVSQLVGMTASRITHINGIGEQSAAKIKSIVDEMYQAVIATARVHIDIGKRGAQQDALVRALYALRNGAPLRAQARALLSSEPNAPGALADAKPATGALRWLFSGARKRAAAARASEYLASLANGAFADVARRIADAHKRLGKVVSATDAYNDFEQNAAAYYTLLEGLGLTAPKTEATGLPAQLVAEIEAYPIDLSHMRTQLRRYQLFGAKYALHQGRSLLGDEMGLGKTIQALAAISDLAAKGETHFLVVCPASVLVNWQREAERHTDLGSIIIHGWDKADELAQWKAQGGIGITNYESMVGLAGLIDFAFGVMVVDEAHFVKNPQAQRTQALASVAAHAARILYMTGTPLENRVDEMCFLVGCLRDDIARRLAGMKTLASTGRFKTEIAPVYLRRVRDDVLDELPDLIESEEWSEPTDAEAAAYALAVRSGNFMAMRRVSWDVDAGQSTKAARLAEICDEAAGEGRKVIVFSFFLDTLGKVCDMLGERALGPITGGVTSAARQELIDAFAAAEDGKVLVAQVQAGGVGLNIQAASVVVFAEPQIKPSLESQAISRAYRMGQVRDVHVHRLLCANTVDEHMVQILRAKQAEFDAYAEDSVAGEESLRAQGESAWVKSVIKQEQARLG